MFSPDPDAIARALARHYAVRARAHALSQTTMLQLEASRRAITASLALLRQAPNALLCSPADPEAEPRIPQQQR